MTVLKNLLALFFLSLALCACASQQKALLEKDYQHLSNDELLTYYDNLSAEIASCEGGQDRASVGVGTGTGIGSHAGVFFGLSHGISTCNPEKLLQRRREVMQEMQRRGLRSSFPSPAPTP
jgi:hypothetical protein